MITRPATRPQSILRAVVKQTSTSSRTQSKRFQHAVPQDWHLRKIADFQNQKKPEVFAKYGVPGFLSKNTFDQTYSQYTQHLTDRLNEWTAGTTDEHTSAMDLHYQTAHIPTKAALYNHAAMAVHTQFFFESLAHIPESVQPREPGLNFKNNLKEDNVSLDQLRTEFFEIASSVFGNGFVWLMKPSHVGGLSILATYNAGSPWQGAYPRRDNRDMANFDARSLAKDIATGSRHAGSFGNHSINRAKFYEGTLDAHPILCVNLWQHQWIPDYGVFGREAYLKAWWDAIDWQVVDNRISLFEVNDLSRVRASNATSVLSQGVRQEHSLA